jgi:hypothetical protein
LIERLLEDAGEAMPSPLAMFTTADDGVPANPEPASEIEPINDCCGIDCVAVRTVATPTAAPPAIVPESFETRPQAPQSVVREPLVRPPIGRVA